MRFKNYRSATIKSHPLWLVTVFCMFFCNFLNAQDFKWVYIPEPLTPDPSLISHTHSIVTDSNGNIYATGYFREDVDFDDSDGVENVNTTNHQGNLFVVKLNKDKSLQWIKYFSETRTSPIGMKLSLDRNENLILAVQMGNEGFDGVTFQPDNTHLTGTVTGKQLGLILKMDLDGNIGQSRFFDLYSFTNTIDRDNNIIVSGTRVYYDQFVNEFSEMQIIKLDENLQTIWQKNIDGKGKVSPGDFYTNSLGDIIFSGMFFESMEFGGVEYVVSGINDHFIGKLDMNGQEAWFKTTDDAVRPLIVDDQDNIYLSLGYNQSNVRFGNQVITMPAVISNDTALLKVNPDGDIIWHKSFYGNEHQGLVDLAINSYGELIILLKTTGETNLNGEVIVYDDYEITSLVKLDGSGNLIDIKEIVNCGSRLAIDNEDDVLMYGSFSQIKDFDPHPTKQHMKGIEDYDFQAFILKLSNCDSDMPSGDAIQSFCAASNPTVKNLKTDQARVKWYDSITSTVPLPDTLSLQDGVTYYAAREKIPNCPEITGRFGVMSQINPIPPAPTVNSVQPCFTSGMLLSDLDIQGQDLKFYANATTPLWLSASTIISPGTTYYVSQKIGDCQGPRVAFSISGQSAIDPSDYSVYACDTDKNATETLDLSDYNNFIVPNFSARNISMTYHKSEQDALGGINPISNYQNYPAGNEKVYVRAFSNLYSCYDVGVLSINIAAPPEIVKLEVRDWADNNSITVLPYNAGHSYSLDGINYQSSNIFDKLDLGEYEVYVKDNGDICEQVSKKVYVLGYPKFFTPNGDGINDYWKIKFAIFQISIYVEIYDRYGKLITGFDKTGIGWDGKLKGQNLPATDYWFRIVRMTDREIIYRGHFSLVR